jgi:hypothetical protein
MRPVAFGEALPAGVRLTLAASGVMGLSLELDQMSATYLSKAVQVLVRPKYTADSNTGTSPEDKISSLASSVSRFPSK